jgi:flagellar hook-basal body complex protein FliE
MINALSALTGFGVEAAAPVARAPGPQAAAGVAGVPDFGAVLAEVASSSLGTVRAGEATAVAGLQGSASVQQVVEAVMSAEQTLQAALAVRDKVVAAYQEISRMAI